ncbi:unnamed protein product, partial [Brassica oleracea]
KKSFFSTHLLTRVKSSLTNLHTRVERLGSTLVFSLVVAVCLVAFGFYIARNYRPSKKPNLLRL